MTNTETHTRATDSQSGFVTVRTQTGQTVELFVLSAEDFEELKPDDKDYSEVAAMMGYNKPENRYMRETPNKERPNQKERINLVIKHQKSPQ